ncbi:MAG: DUF126 domain-containing protein [Bacteroidota bacterium]
MKTYKVKKIVRGNVQAEAIVCPHSFSFLGDIDLDTAEIIIDNSKNKGISITGKILIFDESKGSSGGSTVLITLAGQGKAPKAIVSVKPADFNLVEGAIVSKVPYASDIDIASLNDIKTGKLINLNLDEGTLTVLD